MNKERKQQISIQALFSLLAFFALSCTHVTISSEAMSDPEDYKKVRDAKDWLNPYLIIERDGVTVICNALARDERKFITLPQIDDYLKNLPATAWPYGKIIGVQEAGIGSGNDGQLIGENKKKIEQILESLKIKPNWWPS